MSRRLIARQLSEASFAPYGRVLRPPAEGRLDFIDELQNLRPHARARLSLAALQPSGLPLTVAEMEAHPCSAQAFVPIDVSRYLVLVAPTSDDGGPDVARLEAFVAPCGLGILYAAGTWHHGMRVLDRPGRLIVHTFVDGSENDDVFVSLPEPVVIAEA